MIEITATNYFAGHWVTDEEHDDVIAWTVALHESQDDPPEYFAGVGSEPGLQIAATRWVGECPPEILVIPTKGPRRAVWVETWINPPEILFKLAMAFSRGETPAHAS